MDTDRVKAADKILKMGNVAVCKTTRAGFTTSAVIAAERWDLKTLVIAPTRNILSKTVRKQYKITEVDPVVLRVTLRANIFRKLLKKIRCWRSFRS